MLPENDKNQLEGETEKWKSSGKYNRIRIILKVITKLWLSNILRHEETSNRVFIIMHQIPCTILTASITACSLAPCTFMPNMSFMPLSTSVLVDPCSFFSTALHHCSSQLNGAFNEAKLHQVKKKLGLLNFKMQKNNYKKSMDQKGKKYGHTTGYEHWRKQTHEQHLVSES